MKKTTTHSKCCWLLSPAFKYQFMLLWLVSTVVTHANDPGGSLSAIHMVDTPAGALNFDGINDYVNVGNNDKLKFTGSFTLEAWVRPTGVGSGGIDGGVIMSREGEYEIAFFPDGTLRFALANSANNWAWINTGLTLPLNTWNHISFTYSQEAGTIIVSKGTERYSTPRTGSVGDRHPNENDFRIGGRQNFVQYFKGDIDEVRVWNRALCTDEIRYHQSGELSLPQTGLVAYFKMNQGIIAANNSAISQVIDISGNNLTGTLVNFARTGLTSNWTQGIVTGIVPHYFGEINAPVDPVQANTIINTSANWLAGTVSEAQWDWGDNTKSPGTYADTRIMGSHTYYSPGVYTVKLSVTNECGQSFDRKYQYIVVYNPTEGFVTGGGWIDSPTGAYIADPNLVGKASFGFVSRYKKGATIPTGNTAFEFNAGNLVFRSSSYEWLVIAGAKAQFKGEGTINGKGQYGFLLSAIDGHLKGSNEPDKFRIKIWDKAAADAVVYDNGLGAAEYDDVTGTGGTALGGGSIVIHSDQNSKSAREAFESEPTVKAMMLHNYPNPVEENTIIAFSVPESGEYRLDLLDTHGNVVRHLKTGIAQAGEIQQVHWQRRQTQPGVYLTRLITAKGIKSSKLLVK